jgi:hypothetical protein
MIAMQQESSVLQKQMREGGGNKNGTSPLENLSVCSIHVCFQE